MLKETEILLLLSRVNPTDNAFEDAKSLLKEKTGLLDFSRMFDIASKNGTSPLLYHNLKDCIGIPEDFMHKLRNAYLYTTKQNLLNAQETMTILTLLKREGVDAIPLKGSLASELIFENSGLYPSADIDILVRLSYIEKAEKTVTKAGYVKIEGISDRDLLSTHYHLVFQKQNHNLEIHWNLVKRYYDIPPDFWWQDIVTMEYEGMQIPMVSIERYIIYTVFRLFDHGFRPLKFFVLVSEMINKHQREIDWKKLIAFSKHYKMQRLMIFTLKILNDLLGTEIPYTILQYRIIGYVRFKSMIISGLFQEVKKPHLRMVVYTFLLDTPLDWIRMLTERVFPKIAEVRIRYGLPPDSKKVYAYYILNPLLVLLRKAR